MPREGQHHRRVIPCDQRALAVRQQGIEQMSQSSLGCLDVQIVGELRRGDGYASHLIHSDIEPGLFCPLQQDRFFPINNAVAARDPRHEMLGSLRYEVPPQMAEANQSAAGNLIGIHVELGGEGIGTGHA